MKKFLSILFCLSITLFIYSQEVTVSGGHSVQENKTTKVILNAVNGSVEIHKHVLDGVGYGTGSGSAWNSDTGYTSIITNTTVNTSTSEYLCDTPAELVIDKPIKLSIGGDDWYSFTINPTGGTQYWDVKGFDKKKFWWGVGVMILSIAPFGYAAYSFESNDNLIAGIISGIGGVGLFTTGSVMMLKSNYKITLVKIEY
jgi:hypothetical protein